MNVEKRIVRNSEYLAILGVVLAIAATAAFISSYAVPVQAQLTLGGPPPDTEGPSAPYLEQEPPSQNASERVATIIRAEEFVFAPNETVTIPTAGTNDMDVRGNPPAGITVIIDNASVTLTKAPVMIPGAEASPAAPPATDAPPAPAAPAAEPPTPPPPPAADEEGDGGDGGGGDEGDEEGG